MPCLPFRYRRGRTPGRIAVEAVDGDMPHPPRDRGQWRRVGLGVVLIDPAGAVRVGSDGPASGGGLPEVLVDGEAASRSLSWDQVWSRLSSTSSSTTSSTAFHAAHHRAHPNSRSRVRTGRPVLAGRAFVRLDVRGRWLNVEVLHQSADLEQSQDCRLEPLSTSRRPSASARWCASTSTRNPLESTNPTPERSITTSPDDPGSGSRCLTRTVTEWASISPRSAAGR